MVFIFRVYRYLRIYRMLLPLIPYQLKKRANALAE